MPNHETPAERYRRLAAECLDVANNFPRGDHRDALLRMAQVWQRFEVHPLGWTGRGPENRLTDPGFRGESPWLSIAPTLLPGPSQNPPGLVQGHQRQGLRGAPAVARRQRARAG